MVPVVQHEHQALAEDGHHVQAQRHQEQHEEPVVAAADTVVHPRAVVVERLRAPANGCQRPTRTTHRDKINGHLHFGFGPKHVTGRPLP